MAGTNKIDVAVIGGGMGGLCAAIGLLKHNHLNVQIYESAHHFSEIGAGVAFGPNAQRALRLIGETTEEAYLRQVTHNKWKEYANSWFEYRMGAAGDQQGKLLANIKNETGQATVHRAKFLDEFVRLVPKEICHFGARVVKLEELNNGRIRLDFKEGEPVEADCVIGADGIHSVVRKWMVPEGDPAVEPQFTHSVAYRGLVPMERAIEAIGEQYPANSFIHCGYGGCIMTYPIDFGKTMNIVAINSSYEKWEGPWVQKADYQKIENEFANWGGHYSKKIIKLLDSDETAAWSMWDMLPAATYCKGNVVVLGDAAHASTPFQGQGAGQAIEDAYVLASLMGMVKEPKEAAYAFKAYDKIRRPRSQAVCKTSREMGEIVALRLPSIGDDFNELKRNIEWRMDWMWHRDIRGELEEATIIFSKLRAGDITMEDVDQ